MIISLTKVRGIGPATAQTLAEHGIHSVNDLAATHAKQLTAIPGFSNIRAEQVIDDALQLLANTDKLSREPVKQLTMNPGSTLKGKKKKIKHKDKVKKNKIKKSTKKVKDKDKKTKKIQQSNKYQSVKVSQKNKTDRKGKRKSKDKKKRKLDKN